MQVTHASSQSFLPCTGARKSVPPIPLPPEPHMSFTSAVFCLSPCFIDDDEGDGPAELAGSLSGSEVSQSSKTGSIGVFFRLCVRADMAAILSSLLLSCSLPTAFPFSRRIYLRDDSKIERTPNADRPCPLLWASSSRFRNKSDVKNVRPRFHQVPNITFSILDST